MNDKYDCIIIGAGITGLIAARNLAKREVKVLLVEATDRIGGRIYDDLETLLVPKEATANLNHESSANEVVNMRKFSLSYGATKFYPPNNEYLLNEIKRYQLNIGEVKYSKTFVQVKDHQILPWYDLFQKVQGNYYYLEIVKELNELSLQIDPVHAPFDYERTDSGYSAFSGNTFGSSATPSSDSFQEQQNYYKIFQKNVLRSDLFQQHDILFKDYLKNNKIFHQSIPKSFFSNLPLSSPPTSRPNSPSRKKKLKTTAPAYEDYMKQQENDLSIITDFFLLTVELLFEIDSEEISFLMVLNIINLFHFQFEKVLTFLFENYSTIGSKHDDQSPSLDKNERDDYLRESYMSKLSECIFQEFIDNGGQYLLHTPCIGIFRNAHHYKGSLYNSFLGTERTYNKQDVPWPRSRPTTGTTNPYLPVSTAGTRVRNVQTPPIAHYEKTTIQSKFPITNTFLQLPSNEVNIICKLANGELYQCKQIILTIPLQCISSIQILPPLSTTFQSAVQRCCPNDSTNFLQCYALCSNTIRKFMKEEDKNLKNKSNISNRTNRIIAFNSSNAVKHDHNVYESIVHHRQVRINEEDEKGNPSVTESTLVSIKGMRRSVLPNKQESFQLMHPDIETLPSQSIYFHDFVLNPFLRSHWFHLRCGTRNLYTRLCVEAMSPWKYSKANDTEQEEGNSFFDSDDRYCDQDIRKSNPSYSNYPLTTNDDMSLYIANADLSPHWTGWIEGGVYMGTKAAELLYPRIIKQPVPTNFARKI
jgi:ribosomal protein S10